MSQRPRSCRGRGLGKNWAPHPPFRFPATLAGGEPGPESRAALCCQSQPPRSGKLRDR